MLPRGFHIEQVDRSHDPVLRNLLEHYLHDMAQWFEFDTRPDGRYGYDTSVVWDAPMDVHFAYTDDIPIGFALIAGAEDWVDDPGTHDVVDFFVVRRHRRSGVGQSLARHVWDRYSGPWLVRVLRRNVPAVPFWRATIAGYTQGTYREELRVVNGRDWSFFSFGNGADSGSSTRL